MRPGYFLIITSIGICIGIGQIMMAFYAPEQVIYNNAITAADPFQRQFWEIWGNMTLSGWGTLFIAFGLVIYGVTNLLLPGRLES